MYQLSVVWRKQREGNQEFTKEYSTESIQFKQAIFGQISPILILVNDIITKVKKSKCRCLKKLAYRILRRLYRVPLTVNQESRAYVLMLHNLSRKFE